MKYNKDIWSKMQEKLIQLVKVSSREGHWWAAGPWPHQWSGQRQVSIKYSLTRENVLVLWELSETQRSPGLLPHGIERKGRVACCSKCFQNLNTCKIHDWPPWQGGYFCNVEVEVPVELYQFSDDSCQPAAASVSSERWAVRGDSNNSDTGACRLQQGDHWQNITNSLVSNLIMSHQLPQLWLVQNTNILWQYSSFIMQHHPQCNEDYKDKEDESNNNCLLY